MITPVRAGRRSRAIDGSAPLHVRLRYLERRRPQRKRHILTAAAAIIVVWLVVVAVLGMQP